jgi:hypothetical protein
MFARLVLESSLGASARQTIVSREAHAEQAFVKQKAGHAGVKVFDPESFGKKLRDKPLADTFFVLGSGSSVNRLTSDNFREIGHHRSVGINNWPIHPFVPDMYSFDSVPWVGDGQNFRRSLDLLHRPDIIGALPQVLAVRLKDHSEISHIDSLPPEMRSKVHFYGRVMPATRKVANLTKDLSEALNMLTRDHPGVVLDSGASVVRMVGIALALGYRKIVLVGVDLNNTTYFWEKNPLFPEGGPVPVPINNQRRLTHETTDTWIRPFSVIDMLGNLAKVVSRHFGGNIFLGTSPSALASILPVYPWKVPPIEGA